MKSFIEEMQVLGTDGFTMSVAGRDIHFLAFATFLSADNLASNGFADRQKVFLVSEFADSVLPPKNQ